MCRRTRSKRRRLPCFRPTLAASHLLAAEEAAQTGGEWEYYASAPNEAEAGISRGGTIQLASGTGSGRTTGLPS